MMAIYIGARRVVILWSEITVELDNKRVLDF